MAALPLTLLSLEAFLARADQDDLLAVAGVGGPNSSAGRTVNADKVNAALARANDTAASYLLPRYPDLLDLLPADAPQALAGAVFDLAWYWLRDRDGGRGTVDDVVRRRYDDALKYFDDLAKGRAALHLDSDNDGAADSGYGAVDTVHGDFAEARAPGVLRGYA